MRGKLPLILLGAFACILIGRCTVPTPEPKYTELQITRPVYVALKPDTVVKWKDRIVTRIVKAGQIAVAPHAEDSTVSTFCKAAQANILPDSIHDGGDVDRKQQDSIHVVPMMFTAGRFDGKKLELFEARANGDGAIEDFRLHAPFSFAIRDGRALVKGSRFWWVAPALKITGAFALGYAAGHQ